MCVCVSFVLLLFFYVGKHTGWPPKSIKELNKVSMETDWKMVVLYVANTAKYMFVDSHMLPRSTTSLNIPKANALVSL